MAFFDDIGKVITEGGQQAVRQTRNMAERARLQNLLADREAQTERLFGRIGSWYCRKHGNSPDSEIRTEAEAVLKLQSEIIQIRKQLQDLKGQKKCPACGSSVDRTAVFCPFCGSSLPEEQSVREAAMADRCPKCDSPVRKGQKYCNKCGEKLIPAETGRLAEVILQPEEPETPELHISAGLRKADDSNSDMGISVADSGSETE